MNPVPCIFYDNTANSSKYKVKDGKFGLSNIAASVVYLLNIDKPAGWDESIIE